MTKEVKNVIDLSFIQSCYSFRSDNSNKGANVLARARTLFPNAGLESNNISAPAGFIHGYDLGKIVFTALKGITLSGDMVKDRKALKDALESPNLAVSGLIKEYKNPFSKWSGVQDDAHEALGLDDFCMAHFDDDNQMVIKSYN